MATVAPIRPGVVQRGVARTCPGCGLVIDAHDLYWAVQRMRSRVAEPAIKPEDTLRAAGIADARQARYQRRLSTLLAARRHLGG